MEELQHRMTSVIVGRADNDNDRDNDRVSLIADDCWGRGGSESVISINEARL